MPNFITRIYKEFQLRRKYGYPIGGGFRKAIENHEVYVVSCETFSVTIFTEQLDNSELAIYKTNSKTDPKNRMISDANFEAALNALVDNFQRQGYKTHIQ